MPIVTISTALRAISEEKQGSRQRTLTKRYYDEEQFLLKMREAIKASDRWAEIAPTPLRIIAIYDHDTARPQSSAAA